MVRKSGDFHHEAGLRSGQRAGRSSLGKRAHVLPMEQKRHVKPRTVKIRTSHSRMNREKTQEEVN